MKAYLNDRMFDTLSALVAFVTKHGRSPTLRELAEASGYHKNTIDAHLDFLVLRGLVVRDSDARASYTPTPHGFPELEMQMAHYHASRALTFITDPTVKAQAEQVVAALGVRV